MENEKEEIFIEEEDTGRYLWVMQKKYKTTMENCKTESETGSNGGIYISPKMP